MKELPKKERDLIDSNGKARWVPYLSDLEWLREFEPREIEEIRLAYFYAQSSHGTAGHNRLMLIAKMADRLSLIEDVIKSVEVEDGKIQYEQFRCVVEALLTGVVGPPIGVPNAPHNR